VREERARQKHKRCAQKKEKGGGKDEEIGDEEKKETVEEIRMGKQTERRVHGISPMALIVLFVTIVNFFLLRFSVFPIYLSLSLSNIPHLLLHHPPSFFLPKFFLFSFALSVSRICLR
jgi:hypothetical protein